MIQLLLMRIITKTITTSITTTIIITRFSFSMFVIQLIVILITTIVIIITTLVIIIVIIITMINICAYYTLLHYIVLDIYVYIYIYMYIDRSCTIIYNYMIYIYIYTHIILQKSGWGILGILSRHRLLTGWWKMFYFKNGGCQTPATASIGEAPLPACWKLGLQSQIFPAWEGHDQAPGTNGFAAQFEFQ